VKETTNGIDYKGSASGKKTTSVRRMKAEIVDAAPSYAVGLPDPYLPTIPPVTGSSGVIKSFILPGNETGVVC
jgi:hypothetical protein